MLHHSIEILAKFIRWYTLQCKVPGSQYQRVFIRAWASSTHIEISPELQFMGGLTDGPAPFHFPVADYFGVRGRGKDI
jgi:hypothetical protein